MKNVIKISMVILFVFSIAQIGKAAKVGAIPDSVLKIVQRACYDCHSNNGKGFAKSALNFDAFPNYKEAKQASKMEAICDMISAKKMPPTGYVSRNENGKLTDKEIRIICNWTKSTAIVKEDVKGKK